MNPSEPSPSTPQARHLPLRAVVVLTLAWLFVAVLIMGYAMVPLLGIPLLPVVFLAPVSVLRFALDYAEEARRTSRNACAARRPTYPTG